MIRLAIVTIVCFSTLIAGCKDSSKVASKSINELNIGACLPLTGPVASYGQRAQKGIQLAVDELKQNGTSIQVLFEDDQNKTATGVAATQKLIDQNKVPVVIGSAASAVTMALTNVGNERKVVIFTPMASSPELSEKGGPFFFRVAPSDTAQAKIVADWFKEQGINKIAVLYFANTWGQSLFDAVSKYMKVNGGEVTASEGIQEGQMDFRTQIEKFKQSGAQAYYVVTQGKEGGAFVKQARQLGVKVPLYGGDVWSSPEFISVGGKAAEGCRLVAPAKPSGERFDKFAAAYKQKYGEEPDVYAAYSYDTAMILANAVKSGAKTGEQIREYLTTMKPYPGISGDLSFDSHGDVVGGRFDRFEIRDGKVTKL